MVVHCEVCEQAIEVPYYKLGLTILCPACGQATPLRASVGTAYPDTGYAIRYSDFVQLLTYPPHRSAVAPLVEGWLGCEVQEASGRPVLTTTAGTALPLSFAHDAIQSNPQKQLELYRLAMSLMR